MAVSDSFLDSEDLHPIDIVETLAQNHEWEFDRVTDDQIAMAVELVSDPTKLAASTAGQGAVRSDRYAVQEPSAHC